MSVYGSFVSCFPELVERLKVWTKDDKSDERIVPAIYFPTKGGGISRRKYTSGNTVHDITDEDEVYVKDVHKDKITVGDYFYRPKENIMRRVVRQVPYESAADYTVFTVQRVTGPRPDQNEDLPIKEAVFD